MIATYLVLLLQCVQLAAVEARTHPATNSPPKTSGLPCPRKTLEVEDGLQHITSNRCTRLALGGAPVTNEQAVALAAALRDNTALTHLNLGNMLGKKLPVSTQGKVHFEWEGKPWLDSAGLVLVLDAIHETKLQNFYLGRNEIGHDAAAALAKLLKATKTITDLQVVGTEIGVTGTQTIANALRNSESSPLRSLSLKACEIGPEGAVYLSEALGHSDSVPLTTLDIGSNAIGNGGAEALGDMLENNTSLLVLGLYGNEIGKAGVESLRRGLTTNSHLHTLYLVNNHLSAPGAKALNLLLKTNVGLTHVYCAGNGFGQKGASLMLDALRNNALLQELSFGVGDWGWEGHNEMKSLLSRNMAWSKAGTINKEIIRLSGAHCMHSKARLGKVEAALEACSNTGREVDTNISGLVGLVDQFETVPEFKKAMRECALTSQARLEKAESALDACVSKTIGTEEDEESWFADDEEMQDTDFTH